MEVLTNIGFDWQVAIANFISFILIFLILKRYAFGPMSKIIDDRKKVISEGVDKAQQSETELLIAKQKAEEELKAARKEANQIVAKAKENGDDLILRAQIKADEKAELELAKAYKNIEKQKEQMESDLLEKTAELVALGVSKVLNENVDEKQNEIISRRALETLKKS